MSTRLFDKCQSVDNLKERICSEIHILRCCQLLPSRMLRRALNNPLQYKIVGKLKPVIFEKNDWAHHGDIFDNLSYLIPLLSKQTEESNIFINDRKRMQCDEDTLKLIPEYSALVRRGRCWLISSTKIYYNDQIYVLNDYCFDSPWMIPKCLQKDKKTIHLFVLSTPKTKLWKFIKM